MDDRTRAPLALALALSLGRDLITHFPSSSGSSILSDTVCVASKREAIKINDLFIDLS